MANETSLGARLTNDLLEDFTVSVVSVSLALLFVFPFYRMGFSVTEFGPLLLAIAVFLPYAYNEYWPIRYSGIAAVVWTVSAALVTTGVFVGTYQLAQSSVSVQYDSGIAFLVTVVVQYGTAALFTRVHQTS